MARLIRSLLVVAASVILEMPNSVYTADGVRITIDIVDAKLAALSKYLSVTWNIGCQYNNINMPDNCPRAMAALGMASQVSAYWHHGRTGTPGQKRPVDMRYDFRVNAHLGYQSWP